MTSGCSRTKGSYSCGKVSAWLSLAVCCAFGGCFSCLAYPDDVGRNRQVDRRAVEGHLQQQRLPDYVRTHINVSHKADMHDIVPVLVHVSTLVELDSFSFSLRRASAWAPYSLPRSALAMDPLTCVFIAGCVSRRHLTLLHTTRTSIFTSISEALKTNQPHTAALSSLRPSQSNNFQPPPTSL